MDIENSYFNRQQEHTLPGQKTINKYMEIEHGQKHDLQENISI